MTYVLKCGCTPDASGFGYCSECTRQLREKIWRNMDEKRKNFDRYIDPRGSAILDAALDYGDRDYQSGCSCHINPPCSYCERKGSENE